MDSPKKASVKHLEFQLQREKALTKELEGKCKSFHAQIAQLEQDKAELRREKVQLSEETKKSSRYEDRIHFLQKELETKETIINQERTKAAEARAEAEEVRFNANASINSWKEAEEQWILEQTALNETISEQRSRFSTLQTKFDEATSQLAECQRNLQKERDRAHKGDDSREKLESELRLMHEKVEKFQNHIFDLEQKVYNLDLAGEKQREALNLKDTEVKTLEARITKHVATEERMEQTINSLNDRINAAKMVNLEGKGENEQLLCDLADSRKEIQRLAMQIDSSKRDQEFAAQTHAALQKTHDELREKFHAQQETLKEKNIEVRKHELTISHLNVELKKLESSTSEGSFRCTAMETEIHQLKEEVKKWQVSHEQIVEECDAAKEEVKNLKHNAEKKDEEVVMLKSQMEDRIEALQTEIRDWEKEVCQRQAIIQDLTEQLGNTNEKNALYQGKFLEESESTGKLRHEVERLRRTVAEQEQFYLTLQCLSERHEMVSAFYEGACGMLSCNVEELRRNCASYFLLSREQEATIISQRDELQHLQNSREQVESELAETQQRLESATIAIASLEEKHATEEARRLSSETKRATGAEEITALQEKIIHLENFAAESAQTHEQEVSQLRGQIACEAARTECVVSTFAESLDVATEWWLQRLELVSDLMNSVITDGQARELSLATEMGKSEQRIKELTAFVEDVKASNSRKGIALAERQEAHVAKIQALEAHVQAAVKEKEQVAFQLNALLGRFEKEQKHTEQLKQDMQTSLKNEQVRREAAERQCEKLRSGVEYEVKRKGEYKTALEEVKRLRDETDRCRVQERSLAAEAINKANDEAMYWVRCFEKLKTMAETCRRNGSAVPSIDRDTLSRLESARDRIAANSGSVLKEQPLNGSSTAAAEDPKLKRRRVDFYQ